MAHTILATPRGAATHPTNTYRLPEADRQALLAQSDSSRAMQLIERQRIAFAERNGGCSFGQTTPKPENAK